ncbi:hypothetical protein MMC12_003958 [Toensbergia leucococca]|nr:hypothetical protein [Toensbergia leucococca]
MCFGNSLKGDLPDDPTNQPIRVATNSSIPENPKAQNPMRQAPINPNSPDPPKKSFLGKNIMASNGMKRGVGEQQNEGRETETFDSPGEDGGGEEYRDTGAGQSMLVR